MKNISINKEKLKSVILKKEGDLSVALRFDRCLKVDESLLPVLNEWIEYGTIKEISIQGFSIQRLMNIGKCFTSALISIDLLIKEPQKAKEKVERLERLEKHKRLIV